MHTAWCRLHLPAKTRLIAFRCPMEIKTAAYSAHKALQLLL